MKLLESELSISAKPDPLKSETKEWTCQEQPSGPLADDPRERSIHHRGRAVHAHYPHALAKRRGRSPRWLPRGFGDRVPGGRGGRAPSRALGPRRAAEPPLEASLERERLWAARVHGRPF